MISREQKRKKRHNRVRAKISGTSERPRLSVFKSNKDVYAQLIDDTTGVTLAASHSLKAKNIPMLEKAKQVGIEIAKLGKDKKVTKVVFDRSGYLYTGIIKTLADSAREGGLEF